MEKCRIVAVMSHDYSEKCRNTTYGETIVMDERVLRVVEAMAGYLP